MLRKGSDLQGSLPFLLLPSPEHLSVLRITRASDSPAWLLVILGGAIQQVNRVDVDPSVSTPSFAFPRKIVLDWESGLLLGCLPRVVPQRAPFLRVAVNTLRNSTPVLCHRVHRESDPGAKAYKDLWTPQDTKVGVVVSHAKEKIHA